jgi:translation initiation factor 2-alpha kinase 4
MLEVVDKVISEFHGVRGSTPIEYEFHISHESGKLVCDEHGLP